MIKAILNKFVNPDLSVEFTRKHKNAKTPSKAYEGDAGLDMWATTVDFTNPMYIEYGTGIHMAIPKGYVGLLFARSSVRKFALAMANCVGILDAGYRGEIKFSYRTYENSFGNTDMIKKLEKLGVVDSVTALQDSKDKSKQFYIKPENKKVYMVGDKIGQLVILKLPTIKLKEKKELTPSERGTGGHGSSGIR